MFNLFAVGFFFTVAPLGVSLPVPLCWEKVHQIHCGTGGQVELSSLLKGTTAAERVYWALNLEPFDYQANAPTTGVMQNQSWVQNFLWEGAIAP